MDDGIIALIVVYAFIFLGIFVGTLIFFVPTFIAFIRKLKHKWVVFLINLFGSSIFGIGWVLALLWAILPEPFENVMERIFPSKKSSSIPNIPKNEIGDAMRSETNNYGFCSHCGAKLNAKTPFCSNCGKAL